jgi:hypothetical protein
MADTSVKGMIEPIPNYKPGSMSGIKVEPLPNYKPGSIGDVGGMLNPLPYSDKTLDKNRLKQLIMEQATARGVDPAVALRIAEKESSLNPTAKNPKSSAYGLFQIIDPTWERYGGTKENRGSVLDNIRIGMDIIADSERTYIKKFGRAPSPAELYSMHFLGSTGGPRVLGADPNSPLSSVVSPKVIKQNPDLRGKTVGEFIASMQKKMGAVGDTALARRSVKEQGSGTVPMPQDPKDTMRGRERLQPLAQDMVNQLGPNYQAALAAMALADTREDDEDDENSLARQYRDQIAAQETEDIFSTPQRIAGLELSAQSPFPEEQQPLMMKDGGEARLSTTFGESAVPENAAEEYARFLEASKKSKVPAPLPAMLKEKIFDPLTKGGLQEEGVYYDTMTPQPITSKSPTTLFAGVPGAKVVELGGLQDTTLGGFVFARPSSKGKMVEDVVFVAPPYSKRASDILFRRAPERWVENPNQELERQVLLGHETEHLLKRRGNRDINETFDQLAKQAREEDFIGSFFKKPASGLRSKFVKDAAGSASYLKDKFGVTLPSYFDPKKVGTYTFHEQVATLAGIEQAFGVDLTQDPVLRKTLFEDPDVRRAYSAVTGLRQTRLDPRDLPPYTLQPDIPYNPKAAEIRTKPVKKAKGGEMFADPMGVADSGPITADTRKALTTRQGLNAAEMMRMLQGVGREGVSNLESLARGSVSAVPGVVGDIESIFRDDKNRRFATSKEVERQYLPQRLTKPTKESEGFVELGTYIDPTVAKPVAKAAAKAGKALGPTAADMLQGMAPAAQPMYIVKPTGGTPYPAGMGSKIDDYLLRLHTGVTSYGGEGLKGKDAKKLSEFIDTKGRDFFTKRFASPTDQIREALFEGRISLTGSDLELFPKSLLHHAREGYPQWMEKLEETYDKATGMRGTLVLNPTGTETEADITNRFINAVNAEKAKLAKEGASPEEINLKIDDLMRNELGKEYGASDAARELRKFLKEEKTPPEKASSVMYAAMKGEPIYDLETAYPQMEFMQPNTVIPALASVVDDLDRMSFPEALIRGLQKTDIFRNEEAAIAREADGKKVPSSLFDKGVAPISNLGDFSLVQVKTPFAVRLEGAAMKHSIGNYGTNRDYGFGGKDEFLAENTKVYSIRDTNNRPVVSMDVAAIYRTPKIGEIRSVFNSAPNAEEKQAVFKSFDTILKDEAQEYMRIGDSTGLSDALPVNTYTKSREGKTLPKEDRISIDWWQEYTNYLKRKQNAD